jgi:predicted DNA-binding protein (UPF0251 family)
MPEQTKTFSEAATYLGVSRRKVWQLAKDGQFEVIENPLDKREKRVKLSELKRLKGARNGKDDINR